VIEHTCDKGTGRDDPVDCRACCEDRDAKRARIEENERLRAAVDILSCSGEAIERGDGWQFRIAGADTPEFITIRESDLGVAIVAVAEKLGGKL